MEVVLGWAVVSVNQNRAVMPTRYYWLTLRIALILGLLLAFAATADAQRGRTTPNRPAPAESKPSEPEKEAEPAAPARRTERSTPKRAEPRAPARTERSTPTPNAPRRTERTPTPRTERSTPTRNAPQTERTPTPRTSRESGSRTRTSPGRSGDSDSTTRSTPSRTRTSPGASRSGQPTGNTVRRPVDGPVSQSDWVRRNEPTPKREGARGQTDRGNRDRPGRVVYVPPVRGHVTSGPILHAPIYSGVQHYRPQPVFYLDRAWPWERRRSSGWSPRYVYEQTAFVPDGRGRETRLELIAEYRQRVVSAGRNRSEIELDVESFQIYENGRYLGRVDRIPNSLSRMRATVSRRGDVRVDRDVMLVGTRRTGFELVVTSGRGAWHDAYYGRDGVRIGKIDLRRGRVREARGSRLLGRGRYDRLVPVSLLPDDPSWLLDYGDYSISAFPYDRDRYDDYGYDDGYYYGSNGNDARYFDFGRSYGSNDRRQDYGTGRRSDDPYLVPEGGWDARSSTLNPSDEERFELPSLSQERVETVTLPGGESVELRREVKLRRVQ